MLLLFNNSDMESHENIFVRKYQEISSYQVRQQKIVHSG